MDFVYRSSSSPGQLPGPWVLYQGRLTIVFPYQTQAGPCTSESLIVSTSGHYFRCKKRVTLVFLPGYLFPFFKSRLRILAQNQLTKGEKEGWEVDEISTNDKWEALVFLATVNQGSEIGTFQCVECSGESVFELGEFCIVGMSAK